MMTRLFLYLFLASPVLAATIQVGTGQTYATITLAISNPSTVNGDIINVHAGTYPEGVPTALAVNKSVTIQRNASDIVTINNKINVSVNNVTIDGLEIIGRDPTVDWAGIPQGVTATNIIGLTVKNCTIHFGNGTGNPTDIGSGAVLTNTDDRNAAIYYKNSSRGRFLNNEIYGCFNGIKMVSNKATSATGSITTNFSDGTIVSDNYIHDNLNDGVQCQGSWMTIVDNRIFDNVCEAYSTKHGTQTTAPLHCDGIQNIQVEADGQSNVHHQRILRNRVRNHSQQIFQQYSTALADPTSTDLVVANNLMYMTSGLQVHGMDPSVGFTAKGQTGSSSDGMYIYNNTSVNLNSGIDTNTNSHIKNNIAMNCNTGINQKGTSATGEVDYNLYYGNSTDLKYNGANFNVISSSNRPGGLSPTQEENFVRATSTPLNVDPTASLSDIGAALKTASQAISAATSQPSTVISELNLINYPTQNVISTDMTGYNRVTNWDIGAYEYNGGGPTPTPSPSATPSATPTPTPTPSVTPSPTPNPQVTPSPAIITIKP